MVRDPVFVRCATQDARRWSTPVRGRRLITAFPPVLVLDSSASQSEAHPGIPVRGKEGEHELRASSRERHVALVQELLELPVEHCQEPGHPSDDGRTLQPVPLQAGRRRLPVITRAATNGPP